MSLQYFWIYFCSSFDNVLIFILTVRGYERRFYEPHEHFAGLTLHF